MGAESAWEALSQMPVGRVVAWILLIIAIVGGICTATVKLYKLFERYKKLKDSNDNAVRLIAEHDNALVAIKTELQKINARLDKQDETTMSQLSHSIVVSAERAIREEKITFSELKSLTGMYKEYRDVFHGNGYIKALMDMVVELPVIGHSTE